MNPCLKCKHHCCIGDYGTFATLGDVKRIAKGTGMKPSEFAFYGDICGDPDGQAELMDEGDHSYFNYTSNGKVLQMKSKNDGECIFLKDKQCTVYEFRPLICKIFPIGFSRSKEGVKFFIEPEDEYCAFTKKKSMKYILECLNYTSEQALALVNQFLDEIEEYKKIDFEGKDLDELCK